MMRPEILKRGWDRDDVRDVKKDKGWSMPRTYGFLIKKGLESVASNDND